VNVVHRKLSLNTIKAKLMKQKFKTKVNKITNS